MLPHSKEYYCQKSNVNNVDSVYSIKRNSIWNYDMTKIDTLSKDTVSNKIYKFNENKLYKNKNKKKLKNYHYIEIYLKF